MLADRPNATVAVGRGLALRWDPDRRMRTTIVTSPSWRAGPGRCAMAVAFRLAWDVRLQAAPATLSTDAGVIRHAVSAATEWFSLASPSDGPSPGTADADLVVALGTDVLWPWLDGEAGAAGVDAASELLALLLLQATTAAAAASTVHVLGLSKLLRQLGKLLQEARRGNGAGTPITDARIDRLQTVLKGLRLRGRPAATWRPR